MRHFSCQSLVVSFAFATRYLTEFVFRFIVVTNVIKAYCPRDATLAQVLATGLYV